MSEVEKKAKRRIKRFLETGEPQARVHQVDTKTFQYKVKHHIMNLFFKLDSIGRLRKVKS